MGVNDEGDAVGLAKDQFVTEDIILLHWNNLVEIHLRVEFFRMIHGIIQNLNGQRVLVVQCLRSNRPVVLRRDNAETFFVRTLNGMQPSKASEVPACIDLRLPRLGNQP